MRAAEPNVRCTALLGRTHMACDDLPGAHGPTGGIRPGGQSHLSLPLVPNPFSRLREKGQKRVLEMRPAPSRRPWPL
jgi:hypothetical protein